MSTCNANSFDKFFLERIAYKLKRPKTLQDTGKSEMGATAYFAEMAKTVLYSPSFPASSKPVLTLTA